MLRTPFAFQTCAALTALAAVLVASPRPAAAQTCGTDHTIKAGETLSDIAARVYGNPAQWTIIFYANQDRLGSNVSLLVPGLAIRLPCVGGAQAPASTPAAPAAPAAAAAAPAPQGGDGSILISSIVRHMELLTADGYPPYTGRTLEGGGMLTQVIMSALDEVKTESKGRFDYGVSWVNDWAAHLNPLLMSRAFDVGFPWAKPNCDNVGSLSADVQFRCQRFFYSEPLYEVVTTAFVRNDSKLTALRSELVNGATFCRPTGYPVADFDENGRNWLRDGRIKLLRPATIAECFKLLGNGTVDAVAVAELVGRSAAAAEGMTDSVRELDPPLSLTTLHAIVSKAHPNARTLMYYINAGLAKSRDKGEFDRIIERHLARFWEAQSRVPNPALATMPAAARPGAPAAPPTQGATAKQ